MASHFESRGDTVCSYGPLTRYVTLRVALLRECRERFPRHRGLALETCITAWSTCRDACGDRWLSDSFEVGGGENVPGIPSACTTRNFRYLIRGSYAVIRIRTQVSQRLIVTFKAKTINDNILLYSVWFGYVKETLPYILRGYIHFHMCIYTFKKAFVRESKINAIARAQLTFKMTTLLQKYIYNQSQYSTTWGSKCLALIAQVARTFGMSPKVGGSHSVESPMMVDPQCNILHWESKWIFKTVCWDAVGCEWGTTSVYFGITYVCFIPGRLPAFAVGLQYQHWFFISVKSIIWRTHTKS